MSTLNDIRQEWVMQQLAQIPKNLKCIDHVRAMVEESIKVRGRAKRVSDRLIILDVKFKGDFVPNRDNC